MRTTRHPMDYHKRARPLTAEEQAMNARPLAELAAEDALVAPALKPIRDALERGEIDLAEWKRRRAAALAALAGEIAELRAGYTLAAVVDGTARLDDLRTALQEIE